METPQNSTAQPVGCDALFAELLDRADLMSHVTACICERCKSGSEVFLLPSDVERIFAAGFAAASGSPTVCPACNGSMVDPGGVWSEVEGAGIDFCRECNGSGRDLTKPPCGECGAMTPEEADKKCLCSGDKDWCNGCQLWPDASPPAIADTIEGTRHRVTLTSMNLP